MHVREVKNLGCTDSLLRKPVKQEAVGEDSRLSDSTGSFS